jgi:nucleotide-binding universal stress UspA family protein/dihydroneopterin aldolase
MQAYVTEIRSSVPLQPGIQPEEMIAKAEYAEFLAATRINLLRPEANLEATCAAQYRDLLEHIDVHRYFMGIEQQRDITYQDAVVHWYDEVYQPVVKIIKDLCVLREFPDRTETDLYLWLAKHRAEVADHLGWQVDYEATAADFVAHFSERPSRVMSRLGKRVLEIVLPDELEPAELTAPKLPRRRPSDNGQRLFSDILVAISGAEPGWLALEQAIEVAKREDGIMHGLYVVEQKEDEDSIDVSKVRDRFNWRCGEVHIKASFTVEAGPIARTICEHARWADLVAVPLTYPPQRSPISKLSSGFRAIIKRCASPVLVVPGVLSTLSNPLLAYDGSEKARAGLYAAAYLSGNWDLPLTVVCVEEGRVNKSILDEAKLYLDEQGVQANFLFGSGDVADEIVTAAAEHACDFIIMGAYGRSLVPELVLGTAVDRLLNSATIPMLICK